MSMKIVYTFRARQDLKEINVPENYRKPPFP